ncbi:hypothetical protein [Hymenobacter sp. YC55]|uniref:hypothetical protein n=1 Tax=Hymenobacter sp. YC55 TaxID=3034019 RepID=UPI0023F8B759|nr:hypothetical protein [Hymenobacter sp. YC55]MDF7815910.1 hypothetical protein [Hymenobacter sp. YC55]
MKALLKALSLAVALHFCCSPVSHAQGDSTSRSGMLSKLEVACWGTKRTIHVPRGHAAPQYSWYEEGYYLTLRYPDNSYIFLLYGGNAVLILPKKRKKNRYYRRESIAGCCPLIYAEVTAEQLPVFEQAFNAFTSKK